MGVSIKGMALQAQATRFLSRFQDEGTWHDREAMELQKAIDTFFRDLRASEDAAALSAGK